MMSSPIRCVIDASIAIKLFIKQDGSSDVVQLFTEFERQAQTELYIPELFYLQLYLKIYKPNAPNFSQ